MQNKSLMKLVCNVFNLFNSSQILQVIKSTISYHVRFSMQFTMEKLFCKFSNQDFLLCEISRDYTSAQVNFWIRTEDWVQQPRVWWKRRRGRGAGGCKSRCSTAAVCVRLNQVIEQRPIHNFCRQVALQSSLQKNRFSE